MERYYLLAILLIFMTTFYRGLNLYKTESTTFDHIMINLSFLACVSIPVYFIFKVFNGLF